MSRINKSSRKYFLLLFLILSILSCNKTPTDNDEIIMNVSNELIPMNPGNTWIYLDSVWYGEFDSLAYVAYDTITIFDTTSNADGKVWFRAGGIIPGLGMIFRISNDNVFSYDYGWDGEFDNLKFIPPNDTLQSFDTYYWFGQYERTVEYLNYSFITELGTFDSCAVYKGNNYSFSEEYIVAPGIGIIKSYAPSRPPTNMILFPYTISTLIEYDLVIE